MILKIPAQYAKFLTSLVGLAVVYLQSYGATWHLVPAITGIAAALGVFGVPNAPKPQAPVVTLPPLPSSLPPTGTG